MLHVTFYKFFAHALFLCPSTFGGRAIALRYIALIDGSVNCASVYSSFAISVVSVKIRQFWG